MTQNICHLTKLSSNRYIVDQTMEFSRNMNENIRLRFTVRYKMSMAPKENTFLNVTMGLCELLDDRVSTILLRSVLEELRKSSNLPYACPLEKNYLYKLENFSLTESMFPPYTPIVNFKFRVEMFEKQNQILGSLETQGATIKK
ncbi:uncharacterized protein LOC133322329 [Musca vetustissima]|uniref:uncharacterized protein LOC133322329 n=1 Tax=Musca vetustissima TaxID=27455 RepID=UPI002AB6F45E|nr:uncharacterized protein LOC133322329 [Musca vetustissima]